MTLATVAILLLGITAAMLMAWHVRVLMREQREFRETGRIPRRWIIGRITSAPGHKRSQTNEHPR